MVEPVVGRRTDYVSMIKLKEPFSLLSGASSYEPSLSWNEVFIRIHGYADEGEDASLGGLDGRAAPPYPMVRLGNVAASRRSTLGFHSGRSVAALLLLAALGPATAVAQGASATSLYRALRVRSGRAVAITRQCRISNQLESDLQPLRVGVVDHFSGKTVGRITV